MFRRKNRSVLLLACLLAACGGGGGGGGGSSDPGGGGAGGGGGGGGAGGGGGNAPEPEVGVFLDSAVAGLGYRTDTLEGMTDAEGAFEYVDGESVVFVIGDIELPPVAGREIVTPLDVFGTDDVTDARVVNLARLLQSLDEDADAENGIQIAAAAHEVAGLTLDFDVAVDTFAADPDVVNFVSSYGGSGVLVTESDALDHLEEVSLVGGWHIFDASWASDPQENDSITMIFMADGTYMNAEGTAFVEGDPGVPGIEYGTYSWNPLTGQIEVNVEFDTNGTWGLSDFDVPLERAGKELSFPNQDPDPSDKATFSFALAADQENALIGAWKTELGSGADKSVVTIVFTGAQYAWAEFGPEPPAGVTLETLGAEFGTYTWDPQGGSLVAIPLIDHNGDWAFSGEAQVTAIVDGDTLELEFAGSEGVTLTRVGRGPGPGVGSSPDPGSGSCPAPGEPAAVTQTEPLETLYDFHYDPLAAISSPNGSRPEDGLVEGPDAAFYGVSRYGGVNEDGYAGEGVVYRLTPDGEITGLHTFDYLGPDTLHGINPAGGLILGSDCQLYGTTEGGYNGGGGGTVFKMTLEGTVTYLAGFDFDNGASPLDKLVQGSDGAFYGTTASGGAYHQQVLAEYTGTVFKMTPDGTLTTLVSFDGTNGGTPRGALVEGSDGDFYGVTSQGGAHGKGTIFKVSPDGDVTLLLSFQQETGWGPMGGLVEGADGHFYGTTPYGGASNAGTIFKISPQGEYTLLHSFDPVTVELGCNCGLSAPYAGLLLANDGNFYGTTFNGASGTFSGEGGAVFSMTPEGVVAPVAYFPDGAGRQTMGELIQGSDGHLYGTSNYGGAEGYGAFFRVLLP